ncbi:MAG: ribose-5-phosphate isomerase RpiA [Thermoplasmata archaeon]|nr:ribose-5-phosphate isomerase RpiA [Thermoplasmata archaeon]MCI4359731.1 ribose-5-phosphate isomerase RpiA [Thermoplasmata archaeon]
MDPGVERAKQSAARAAAAQVVRGQRLGLGTGSTAAYAVREIARRFPDGGGFQCVASSAATATLAGELGLSVRDLAAGDSFDVMLDGADEVSDRLDLTKGGGGALFREKLLARRAKKLLIMVDPTKLVPRLGTRTPIPVEVVPFARPVVVEELGKRGLPAILRTVPGTTQSFRSDNGLEILDVRPPTPIEDPGALDAEIHGIPGVLETGLFVGLAERVFVGHADGTVEERVRR